MIALNILVWGLPAPKGSYRPVTNRRTGKTMLLPMSKREKPWRQAVKLAAQSAWRNQYPDRPLPKADVPIRFDAAFYLPKPKTVRRDEPTVEPDLDKLIRCTWDALTESGLIADDSRITSIGMARKFYATTRQPGANLFLAWDDTDGAYRP